jgi:PAS domain S-box-containing protein
LGVVCLVLLLGLLVWQGSFSFGDFGPSSPAETFIFWAISTLIFLLTVTLGFMLFRTAVKLYLDRQGGRAAVRIRTKLVAGAIALSFVPVVFLVLLGYGVMNRNLKIWFTRPAEGIKLDLSETAKDIAREFHARVTAQARWIAWLPATADAASGKPAETDTFGEICAATGIERLALAVDGGAQTVLCGGDERHTGGPEFTAHAEVAGSNPAAVVLATAHLPADLAARQAEIERWVRDYDALSGNRRRMQSLYLLYMLLITLFVLFLSTWIARLLAEQFSGPISALLEAAAEVRRGNLSHRAGGSGVDELGTLVRGFNDMVQSLQTSRDELEQRRRFTEAILESIPTGVISVAADGRIQRVNRALQGIFPDEQVRHAETIDALMAPEDAAEVRYLMKRASRTGLAASQLEVRRADKVVHVAVTVSALDKRPDSGFVVIVEDTSELLRAQKAMAWQEVARRIAHELKNPLTPIALSAERAARHAERTPLTADSQRIIHECSRTILREVESVKQLVDEFSEFARFPAAQPVPSDLNAIAKAAMDVFAGRLRDIDVRVELAPSLPVVNADPEQMKRVVVNLVDNAAEAMQNSAMKRLAVETRLAGPDTVELMVADTGSGVSPEDKEKLFLPYFSTKGRGTGLGLAIVNRVLAEHEASIRVEDNRPVGARFIVEIPVYAEQPEPAAQSEARI